MSEPDLTLNEVREELLVAIIECHTFDDLYAKVNEIFEAITESEGDDE